MNWLAFSHSPQPFKRHFDGLTSHDDRLVQRHSFNAVATGEIA